MVPSNSSPDPGGGGGYFQSSKNQSIAYFFWKTSPPPLCKFFYDTKRRTFLWGLEKDPNIVLNAQFLFLKIGHTIFLVLCAGKIFGCRGPGPFGLKGGSGPPKFDPLHAQIQRSLNTWGSGFPQTGKKVGIFSMFWVPKNISTSSLHFTSQRFTPVIGKIFPLASPESRVVGGGRPARWGPPPSSKNENFPFGGLHLFIFEF